MKHLAIATLLTLLLPAHAKADNRTLDPQVKSLVATVNGNWLALPVMRLGTDDVLTVGFDRMEHDYRRYTYRLEHCEPDWLPSDALFESDWLEGFNSNPIDDYAYSLNTTTSYTHYQLQIPNDRLRLTRSGNYRLTVSDETDSEPRPVATVEFWITEETMPLTLAATTNTDIDANHAHQQIQMNAGYGNCRVTDPTAQLLTVVMQNGSTLTQRNNPRPDIVRPDGLAWQHCRDLIFQAGNEYHKFEMLDLSHPTMGIETILWDDNTGYEAYPFACEPRPNYLYDEDADGCFVIRNSDNWETATTCDYAWVNYRLHCPRLPYGQLIIDGRWTTDADPAAYTMHYDDTLQAYTARILQKQGYYNYRYLWLRPDGTLRTPPSEGDYSQTENRYQAFLYFRAVGDATWRLTAFREVQLNAHE